MATKAYKYYSLLSFFLLQLNSFVFFCGMEKTNNIFKTQSVSSLWEAKYSLKDSVNHCVKPFAELTTDL